MTTAFNEQLPGWQMVAGEVEYYDPLQVGDAEVQVLTWKHFRFAYQHEVRFAWLPPKPETNLEHLDLVLGSLEDICEVVPIKFSQRNPASGATA